MVRARLLLAAGSLVLALAATAEAQTTPTSIQLNWTAPGDDGSIGTATSYDLRYSTAAITATNFASATRWNAMPAPVASGTSQSVTVTGLNPATTYYFAIKSTDDAGNVSPISNVLAKATPALPDLTPPAPLAIAVGALTDTTAAINWTATGDDSLTGTATSYDLRWSTSPITLANWTSANQVTGEPAPALAGTAQSYVVKSLSRETTYYFALRATDDAGNVSGLSNVPSATTLDTMAPSAILNLSANFLWMSWGSADLPRRARTLVR